MYLLKGMSKKRKLLLWLGLLTGIVAVLATILFMFASRYINSEPVQNNIRKIVTQHLGKTVTYQRAYLSIFPLPGLAFSQVVITIPRKAAISAQSVSIYPALLPLLTGKVRLAKLKLEAPDITIDIPEKSQQEKQAKPSSFKEKVDDIDSVISSLRTAVPGLVCVLQRGKLLVREAGHKAITAQDINVRIALVSTGIEISFKGDVGRWGGISARGKFYTEGNNILINDLSVSTGKSSASIFVAKLRLKDKPILEIESGKAVLIFDDIYERRSLLESLYDPLLKIKKLKGVVKVESLKLSGELLHPEKWIIQTEGSVQDIDVDVSELPSPVKIERGQFQANGSTLTLSNVRASIFDSSFTASAVMSGSAQAIDSANVAMSGNIGPETVRRVSKIFQLPPEQTVRAPLSISNAHLIWQARSNLAITGIAAIQNGPTISLDLRKYDE